MSALPKSIIAVALAAVVVLSGLPLGASVASAAGGSITEPSTSPAVTASAETQTLGSSANVSIGYNLTGEVDAGDVQILMHNASGGQGSATPGSVNGTLNLTLGPRHTGGEERVGVYVLNSSGEHPPNASTVVTASTDSPVVIDTYAVSTTSPAAGENVTVNATVNNTGGTTEDFTVRVYKRDGTVSDADNTTVTLTNGEVRHVELNVSYPTQQTANLTVNGEASTEITVGGGGGGPGGGSYTSVSAENATVSLGQSGTVSVTYDLGDDVDTSDAKLELRNHTAALDSNASLVDSDTVTLSVPARSIAGPNRYEVVVRNESSGSTVTETVANVTVEGNVSVQSVTAPGTTVAASGTNVSVKLKNTGPVDEMYQINVYDDATSTFSAGTKWVTVPANTEKTYNVSTSYTVGTRTTYLGNVSYGTTEVYPAATVESVTHISGPTNTTVLSSTVRTSGMLTVELLDGSEQDLAGTGATESSVFEVVLHVNHSVDPGLVIANGQNVSWSVRNTSEHYVVTVTAQPLESQFMRNAPSIDNWDSLSDAQDKADDKLLWYSISIIDEDSLYNANMTNMTIATDAQTFGTPTYDEPNESIEIDLAAPHYTVSDALNDGIYQATIPSSMLSQWGVSGPDELAGTYQGASKTLTTTSNNDGSLDVSMNIHYSSGQVSLSPKVSGGSSGLSGFDDDDDDESSTEEATNETDGTPAENVVEAAVNEDGSGSAVVENVSANQTVKVRFGGANASANGSAADGATNESGNETARVTELGLNLSNDAASLGVNVSSHDAVPDGTPELDRGDAVADADGDGRSDGALGYLSIDLSGASDDDVANATINFEVSRQRLDERNVTPDDVRLYRHHDGEWHELSTAHLGNGSFVAETPGFSVFAVGANRSSSDSDGATTETVTSTATVSPTETPGDSTAEETVTMSAETVEAAETTESEAPGFGASVAVVALTLVAAALRRRD